MIESILAAFAFGTIWFWILATIASIVFIASIENDHYTLPVITSIVLGIAYWKTILAAGWQTIGIVIVGYALAGVLWSLFKWYRHVHKKAAFYHERYGNVLSEDKIDDLKREISVSSNKSRLTAWIAWWPWSLLWSLTGDFFNMLYETMTTAYQKIVDKALGNFEVKPKVKEDVIAREANYRR